MFTFLTPLALFGASLLAIPILIHLFKPRKVRQTPFSSLRWLKVTKQRLSRRMQWHQILLFILRALFILFLIFALAKPVLSLHGKNTFAERFIILDVSRSMSYEMADKHTPFEKAREAAIDLLLHGNMIGDRTTVLLTGSTTAALGPLLDDPGAHLARLQAAKPTLSDTDLSSALLSIKPMLANKRPNTSVDLFYITDNHQLSWSEGTISQFLSGLGRPVRMHLIDVGITSPQNAWVADAHLVESINPPRRFIRAQVGCVGDEGQHRSLKVTHLAGLNELSQPVDLLPGQLVKVEIDIPAAYDTKGKVAQIQIEPKDALSSDDLFWLNLDSRGMVRILLIEPDGSTQIESQQSNFHLRTGLEALSFIQSGSLQITRKTDTTVTAGDLTTADVIVMANIEKLSDSTLLALENRVKAGAGLAVFLGPKVLLPFYNNKFFNASHPSDGLMPAPLTNPIHATQNGPPARITRIQWAHPMLTPLYDPTYGDLAQSRFSTYYQLGTIPPGSAAQVLAWIDDSVPAILERSVGAGKVLVFNMTANDEWCDLPRRKSFVPLLDRMVTRLGGGIARRIFQVGDVVVIPIPTQKNDTKIPVTTPSQKTLTATVRNSGSQSMLRLDAVDEIGVYTIQYPNPDAVGPPTFVVQAGRGDSVLTKTDLETLKAWWKPAEFEVVTKAGAITQNRILLWPWFVGAACLMLLGEMFFVHWLCPIMNPKVISSTVGTHGILAPGTPRQTQES